MATKIKAGLAGALLALLSVLGGMAGFGGYGGVDLTTGAAPAPIVADASVQAELAPEVVDTQNASDAAAVADQEQAQTVTGVLDARPAVAEVGPAVVTIVTSQNAGTTRRGVARQTTGVGSGVIVDRAGYIVTNHHVIENVLSVEVIFSDGTKSGATVVGSDASLDLAVIKVESTVPAVAILGNSDTLEPGQPVVAIGSALGDFRNTVTAGIVSALDRTLEDLESGSLSGLVQTDAAINEGNSGGPLISLDGEVVGINVAVVRGDGYTTAEGLGFAIPSNTVRSVLNRVVPGE
jgi:S1-C subfamily serine protease